VDVKPGYKQTEVGLIPEDWKLKTLGEFISLQRGHDLTERDRRLGEVPVMGSAGQNGVHDTALAKGPGVVLGRSGASFGQAHFCEVDFWPHNTALYVTDFHGNNPRFVFYFLRSIDFSRHNSGGAQQSLNRNFIAPIAVALPPTKAEQRAIASALGDVDALIAALDRLIAKKCDIKQAAMQKLLTGKGRLPGFGGEWKTWLLGEVITYCTSGATPYRGHPDYYRGKVKWITSGELNFNRIFDTIEHISDEAAQKTNLKVHPIGTFLMAITGLEAAGTRGACGIVGNPATTNQSCMAIYPSSKLKTEYLYYYYVFRGNALAFRFCQGTKQQSYTAKLVKLLPIDMPPTVEEQAAIASVLTDMDAEIAALEARRKKTRALKQGMMQELLTGRIRLA
jgi:type I restriction enzyme, S subunit